MARPLAEVVEAGWAEALAPVEPNIAAMGEFLRAEVAAGRTYLPAGEHVLRAFTRPLDDVRVLIVGQDPYPTPGHAVGLSFSVSPTTRPVPRSLANIFREYTADLGHPMPSTGDLSPWAERGVLLLNRALTVEPHKPNSHQGKGWEIFTDRVIECLNTECEGLVFLLWGKFAQNKAKNIDPKRHLILKADHPSPLSAHPPPPADIV